jgi:hypothetical protein
MAWSFVAMSSSSQCLRIHHLSYEPSEMLPSKTDQYLVFEDQKMSAFILHRQVFAEAM